MSMSSSPAACNGAPWICNLPVNEVVFPAVHNAMSSEADGFTAYNNRRSLEDALEGGFRSVQVDSCDCGSLGLQICHSECLYWGFIDIGYRPPGDVFGNVKKFLDANPREVIIIDLQVNDNTLDAIYNVLEGIDGFVDMMYSHPSPATEWPLMSELIDSNERIVFFQHNGPSCRNNDCPPGVHNTFDHMFDTSYDLDEAGLLDYDTSCAVNRGGGGSKAFFLSNHFAKTGPLPNIAIAETVNQEAVLQGRGDYCEARLGKAVNVVMVDFWSVGDVIAYAEAENYRRALAIDPPPPTTAVPTSRPSPSPPPPTVEESLAPSVSGSGPPSMHGSERPSDSPTVAPSSGPTEIPSALPTVEQSEAPSGLPSALPTAEQSTGPSAVITENGDNNEIGTVVTALKADDANNGHATAAGLSSFSLVMALVLMGM